MYLIDSEGEVKIIISEAEVEIIRLRLSGQSVLDEFGDKMEFDDLVDGDGDIIAQTSNDYEALKELIGR
jgi:hypothetical protein